MKEEEKEILANNILQMFIIIFIGASAMLLLTFVSVWLKIDWAILIASIFGVSLVLASVWAILFKVKKKFIKNNDEGPKKY